MDPLHVIGGDIDDLDLVADRETRIGARLRLSWRRGRWGRSAAGLIERVGSTIVPPAEQGSGDSTSVGAIASVFVAWARVMIAGGFAAAAALMCAWLIVGAVQRLL